MTVLDLDDYRDKRTMEKIKRQVAQETAEARARGQAWTEYRPFIDVLEKMGAMMCCSCVGRRSRRTARGARVVKYCTTLDITPMIGGRLTKCDWCMEGVGRLRDGLTAKMIAALVDAYDCDGLPCTPISGSTRVALKRRELLNPNRTLTQLGGRTRTLLVAERERKSRT